MLHDQHEELSKTAGVYNGTTTSPVTTTEDNTVSGAFNASAAQKTPGGGMVVPLPLVFHHHRRRHTIKTSETSKAPVMNTKAAVTAVSRSQASIDDLV